MAPILVTGAAGFIGFHVAQRLLTEGHAVVGLDNVNDYYDPALKEARLALLHQAARPGQLTFHRVDVADAAALRDVFSQEAPTHVVHLAAQAGVRHSLTHPEPYVESNVVGFLNVLMNCQQHAIEHLVYASSSSVYGANTALPFVETATTVHPTSLYAATKQANETLAHSWSHLHGLPTTGLRFFTVYGPWGRPDMALFLFTRALLEGRAIRVFNHGDMSRDFTFIDDVVDAILTVLDRPAASDPTWTGTPATPGRSSAPFRLYNVGNGSPVKLLDFIRALERSLGVKAVLDLQPMQPGDVPATWADTSALQAATGWSSQTSVEQGIDAFVAWYRTHYTERG